MTVYGLHASHEQVHPSDLLDAMVQAEQAGFRVAMSSDLFSPWSERQGLSAFAWSWLGAALQATSLSIGVVNAPGQRYHPAIIAQAIGTLAAMYPGRFWAALGTGEASNEHITGDRWPRKEIRSERRADGLITVNAPIEQLRRVVDAYRDAGGRGKLHLQVHLSWAPDEDTAMAIAHDQWRSNVFAPPVCWDLELTEHFDGAARHVRPQQVADVVHVSADLGRHAAWLKEYAGLGFDEIYLHHVGKEQQAFIDAFGAHVLPELS